MTALCVRGLSKSYGEVPALDRADLDVPEASRTAVVGPSGSGKTTLLRLVAGFERPDDGSIVLSGRDLSAAGAFVPTHRREIGYVPQDGGLFPHLSVAQNIGFGLPRGAADRRQRVAALMEVVGLEDRFFSRSPHELSGGQQQRVALARALARRPKLMLLDEPFSALDAGMRVEVRQAVGAILRQAGIATLLVTHDQVEALSFADRVAVLRQGRVVQAGTPQEVYLRPRDRDTATFLGEAVIVAAELGDGFADCRLGRLAADTGNRRGKAEILVRPEQIHLAAVARGEAAGAATLATVTQTSFGGAVASTTLRLDADGGEDMPPLLVVPCLGIEAPPVGCVVRIEVRGTAHVLEDEE